MATKQMLPARLSPELISTINDMAAAKKTDVDSFLALAVEALKRAENEPVSVSQRVEIFQQSVVERLSFFEKKVASLVSVLTPVLPLLTETEDRSFRAWANSKLSLAWSDLVVSSGGMPSKIEWAKHSAAVREEIMAERTKILENRKNLRRAIGNE